eukprot:6759575-Prymnesium_polylepis.1
MARCCCAATRRPSAAPSRPRPPSACGCACGPSVTAATAAQAAQAAQAATVARAAATAATRRARMRWKTTPWRWRSMLASARATRRCACRAARRSRPRRRFARCCHTWLSAGGTRCTRGMTRRSRAVKAARRRW